MDPSRTAAPFERCALTLVPFTTPVLAPRSGGVFELANIVPHLRSGGRDPVDGGECDPAELVPLEFARNEAGRYHCPVLFKEFTRASKIAAIKTTGTVLSYEAARQLCINPRKWVDPVTGSSFPGADDLVVLQDPVAATSATTAAGTVAAGTAAAPSPAQIVVSADSSKPAYIEPQRKPAAPKPPTESAAREPSIRMGSLAHSILAKAKAMEAKRSPSAALLPPKPKPDHAPAGQRSRYSSGMMAASFTSSALDPVTTNERAPASAEEIDAQRWTRLRAMKRSAFVRLVTSSGDLNVELHVAQCPRTCENFLRLARKGEYDGTLFHRLIPKFMVQGGGESGSSIWGRAFKDEISNAAALQHSGPGVLSMANSGPDSNGRQFFLTFAACPHLDGKHTVFGRLVGGFATLQEIEQVTVDDQDRPVEPVVLQQVLIFQDPVEEDRLAQVTAVTPARSEPAAPAPVAAAPASAAALGGRKRQSASSRGAGPAPKRRAFSNFDAW